VSWEDPYIMIQSTAPHLQVTTDHPKNSRTQWGIFDPPSGYKTWSRVPPNCLREMHETDMSLEV